MKTANRNHSKLRALLLIMLIGVTAYGQTSDTSTITQADRSGEVIKLIDKKESIKYLQCNNGIDNNYLQENQGTTAKNRLILSEDVMVLFTAFR